MAFAGGAQASLAELETRLAAAEAAVSAAKTVFTGSGAPGVLPGEKDGDLYFDIGTPADTGLVYLRSGGSWVSTTFQFWAA